MKRTEIKYVETDEGSIQITKVENVANFYDIEEQYGENVALIYSTGRPMYSPWGSDGVVVVTQNKVHRILPYMVFSRDDLAKFISALKVAGNRLLEIAKANPIGPKEKTILI